MSATIGKINSHGEHVSVFKIMDGSKRIVDIRQNLEKDKLRKLKYIEKDPGKFIRLKSIRGNEKGFSFEGIRNSIDNISIPDEYKRIYYLESTGTQYIKTNYSVDINTEIEIKAKSNTAENKCILCGRLTALNGLSIWADGYVHFGGKSEIITPFNYKDTDEHVYILNKDSYIIDGVSQIFPSESTGTAFNKPNDIFLFTESLGSREGSSTTHDIRRYKGRIFYCKLNNSYLIPAIRKSDNKPGMYDTVTGEFYTNAGTGEFITGPEVKEPSFILPVSLKNFISNSFSETDGKIIGNRSCYSEVIFDKKKITCIQRWGKDLSGKYVKLSMPVTTIFNLDDILDVSLPLDNENISLTNGEDDIFAIMDIYKSVYREAKIEYINLTDEENTLTDKDGNEFIVGYITRD